MKRNKIVFFFLCVGEGLVEYEIVKVLPFDSSRKTMSVVVRHPISRQLILYTKGADSNVLSQLAHTGK